MGLYDLGGGFKEFFIFTPNLGEDDPNWRAYFSNGLKPPNDWLRSHDKPRVFGHDVKNIIITSSPRGPNPRHL